MEWKQMLFGEFYDDTGNNNASINEASRKKKKQERVNNANQNGRQKELPSKIFDVVRNFSSASAIRCLGGNNKFLRTGQGFFLNYKFRSIKSH